MEQKGVVYFCHNSIEFFHCRFVMAHGGAYPTITFSGQGKMWQDKKHFRNHDKLQLMITFLCSFYGVFLKSLSTEWDQKYNLSIATVNRVTLPQAAFTFFHAYFDLVSMWKSNVRSDNLYLFFIQHTLTHKCGQK